MRPCIFVSLSGPEYLTITNFQGTSLYFIPSFSPGL